MQAITRIDDAQLDIFLELEDVRNDHDWCQDCDDHDAIVLIRVAEVNRSCDESFIDLGDSYCYQCAIEFGADCGFDIRDALI